MSTILEALRKAKTEPLPNGVEARPGILNPMAHDYLAAAPRSNRDEVQVLRRIVYGSIAIIVLLALVVISLLLRQQGSSDSAEVETASAKAIPQAVQHKSAEAARPSEQEIPEQPVQIAVVTPMATPTEPPVFQPEPVMIPVSIDGSAEPVIEETDEAVQARAAELRSQLSARPDPKQKRVASSSESGGGGIQDLRIGGIVWDKDSPMAMVEGKIVKPGSVVRGARIIAIHKDSIVLEQNGKQYTVRQ